mgnify:CR=1 FL=1
MRTVIQRVDEATVLVGDRTIGQIGNGLLVLLGISNTDSVKQAEWLVEKIYSLRVFPDAENKMNVNLQGAKGDLLIVSQFTLYGDINKGSRPSFVGAAAPELTLELYREFVNLSRARAELLRDEHHKVRIETGEFGAMMKVASINNGPVTIIAER